MIILLLIISVLIFVFMLFITEDEDLLYLPVMGFVIKLGVLVWLLIGLIGTKVIDEKIKLYEKQNKEIETKVEIAVKQYMEHENKTLTGLKTKESYITLATLYPDLKSDGLIKQEINLYEKNNKKILSLKEQKINKKIYKWWIYFG